MRCKRSLINFIIVIVLIISCSGCFAQPKFDKLSNVSFSIIDQYVAIDNMAAWPNLTLLPNDSIIASVFNQPSHARVEGDLECWISSDNGQIWKYQGTPARHEPNTNRMNVAAGLAHNGDLIVLCSGWENPDKLTRVLPVWVCRSSDAGKTWVVSESAVKLPSGIVTVIPYGDVVLCPGNELAVAAYGIKDQKKRTYSYVLYSSDDGHTWGEKQALIAENANETFILRLQNGRWLAACRNKSPNNISLVTSNDGLCWNKEMELTNPAQHPAHFLELRDGRILVTYGDRIYDPNCPSGIKMRISSDQGRTWTEPVDLLVLEGSNRDCGYPSTVELKDGMLVTTYYSKKVKYHQRYHAGVVRWRLEDTK